MAEGEEESPRSPVAKTSRHDLPAQVKSQGFFVLFFSRNTAAKHCGRREERQSERGKREEETREEAWRRDSSGLKAR